ncbi:M23 family metallopeptidase [Magnetovibrio sp. PR-2]|uniref:M23 family metallopeptidase n=1 Tax=Magnetovibrio sp. PR-2 TaxID=3120356 RepID=UPI002FCE2ABB
MKRILGFLLLALTWGVETQAQDQSGGLIQPLKCTLGTDCWIPNYVDLKRGNGVLDYKCLDASYDAEPGGFHKGTDFALRDMKAVAKGVDVVAAAAGTVIGARDGLKDEKYHEHGDSHADEGHTHDVKGQECGNGVRIKHDSGLVSQYCHLRQNSVKIKAGQTVEQGDVLGLVGLSGQTAFPHLHFQVSQGEMVLDPFVGLSRQKSCGAGEKPLWTAETLEALPYKPTAIFNTGFSPEEPKRDAMMSGTYQDYETEGFPAKAPVMIAWAEMFRVRPNDRLEIIMHEPGGEVFLHQIAPIKAAKAYQYLYVGKRLKGEAWPTGTYKVRFELKSGLESEVVERTFDVR